MVLQKTGKALQSLQASRDGGLSLRDRHVLILSDGRRAAREVVDALGGDAAARIERLLATGYLVDEAAMPAPARIVPERSPEPVAAPRPVRRSLAAARLYVLDMLALQRGWEAAELARAIQRTAEPTYQVPALLDALRYILSATKPSYGQRVAEQLLALMPEDFVARVRDVLDEAPALRSA